MIKLYDRKFTISTLLQEIPGLDSLGGVSIATSHFHLSCQLCLGRSRTPFCRSTICFHPSGTSCKGHYWCMFWHWS